MFFVTFILSGIFFICVFSHYIAYWINFMISFLTAATQPLDTQNTIMTVCPHYLDLRNTGFLITLIFSLFKQQRREVAISENGVTLSYTKFDAHFTFFFLCTGSVAVNMKLLKNWKLDKMIFLDSENSIESFRVSDPIDQISL